MDEVIIYPIHPMLTGFSNLELEKFYFTLRLSVLAYTTLYDAYWVKEYTILRGRISELVETTGYEVHEVLDILEEISTTVDFDFAKEVVFITPNIYIGKYYGEIL